MRKGALGPNRCSVAVGNPGGLRAAWQRAAGPALPTNLALPSAPPHSGARITTVVTFYDSGKTAIFSASSLHPVHKTAQRSDHKANCSL